jgi:fluoroquinolone transport system permease protein
MKALRALVQKDLRVIYRDRFMVFIASYALILAVVARFGVRWVPINHLDLYLAPVIVMFGTLLLGTLLGFALIEEREQGTWLLLRVLPLSSKIVFAYFIVSASFLSLVVSFAAAMLYGYPVADWPAFVLMLGASALAAPLVMLLLGALAKNKIEGLALGKIISAAGVLPAMIFFAPPSWQIVAVWCPLYWLYLGLLQAYAGDTTGLDVLYWPAYPPFVPAVASIVLALVGTAVLVRMYTRSAR